jgi:hypothetical protein
LRRRLPNRRLKPPRKPSRKKTIYLDCKFTL